MKEEKRKELRVLTDEEFKGDPEIEKISWLVENKIVEYRDFSNKEYYAIDFKNCYLIDCDFSNINVDLYGSCFENSKLINCNFENSRFWEVGFSNSYILNSNFKNTILKKGTFQTSIIRNVNFSNSQIFAIDFNSAILENCNLKNVFFRDTDFTEASLKNCEMDSILFSTNFDSTGMEVDDKLYAMLLWQMSKLNTENLTYEFKRIADIIHRTDWGKIEAETYPSEISDCVCDLLNHTTGGLRNTKR